VRTKLRIQFIQHNPRLNAYPALFHVQFEDPVVILRRIHHEALADGLAGLRGSASAQCNRATELPRKAHHADQILTGFYDDSAQRLDLINARIGRIKGARDGVEPDLAFNLPFQLAAQRRHIDQFHVGVGSRLVSLHRDEVHRIDFTAARRGFDTRVALMQRVSYQQRWKPLDIVKRCGSLCCGVAATVSPPAPAPGAPVRPSSSRSAS